MGPAGFFTEETMTESEIIRKAMAALGSRGGKATSAAKAAAVRENGKKGGRPRKLTPRK